MVGQPYISLYWKVTWLSQSFSPTKGAQIDLADKRGFTAFHFAAENGHIDVIEYLLSEGAQVDRDNQEGLTASEKTAPLHLAANHDRLAAVNSLLSQPFPGEECSQVIMLTLTLTWVGAHNPLWTSFLFLFFSFPSFYCVLCPLNVSPVASHAWYTPLFLCSLSNDNVESFKI